MIFFVKRAGKREFINQRINGMTARYPAVERSIRNPWRNIWKNAVSGNWLLSDE
jgi:hypothetical protein